MLFLVRNEHYFLANDVRKFIYLHCVALFILFKNKIYIKKFEISQHIRVIYKSQ